MRNFHPSVVYLFISTTFNIASSDETGYDSTDGTLSVPSAVPRRCIELQTNYSQAISNFTKCAIRSSRPLSVCLHCIRFRHPVNILYHSIQEDVECSRLLLQSEFGAFISESHTFYESLLHRSQCHLCEQRVNYTITVKEQVQAFLLTHDKLMDCVQAVLDGGGGGDNRSVCVRCATLYTQSCVQFEKCVQNPAEWNTCRDVMDRANTSMHIWQNAGCLPEESAEWWSARAAAVYSAASVCLAALVLFYGGVVVYDRRSQSGSQQHTDRREGNGAQEDEDLRVPPRVRRRRVVYTPLD